MGHGAIVGIDLGTTHTVVAWADEADPTPRVFPVPQVVSADEIEARPLFPSFLYAPLPDETIVDPFGDAPWVLGAYGRRRGQEVPARLVSSAKSWLSFAAVDRSAPILPWATQDANTPRLSPIDACRRLLEHVRRSWDAAFPERPLSEQSVVLTVPASFDEVARELTVEAAHRAGLTVRLLEEPQAAFYDFLARHGTRPLEELLAPARDEVLVLVCDVGGGTTDLTLIRARREPSGEVELDRVAVGRHLLLGGDNIDLALAHLLEARLVPPPARLEPVRFAELVLACRAAKERLLGPNPPESIPIAVLGTGSALVGSTARTVLERGEAERLVFEGFLPMVSRDAEPTAGRSALQAFGLPYERDPAITRHVASFFARHADRPAPDALLLNGGLFRAARAAERVRAVVDAWAPEGVRLLPQSDPDLAVARGAVAYGLSILGRGPRIGGGSPHGYYVGVEVGGERRALSVLPRGALEGERHLAKSRGLFLRVGQPVRFELFADDRAVDAPGALVPLDESRLMALPPVTTRFEAHGDAGGDGSEEVPVALEGELSAVGTVELSCVEVDAPPERAPRRFRLAFDLRARPSEAPEGAAESRRSEGPRVAAQKLAEAREAIERVFGKGRADVKPRAVKDLVRDLERLLGERRTWTLEVNRALVDPILAGHGNRRRSEDHERVFFMLAGYCLRPGFGYPGDRTRVSILARLFAEGVAFAGENRVWQQFFIAFRRIAAGLSESRQGEIRNILDPFLAPPDVRLKRVKSWKPLAPDEALELAAWLERVPPERRSELGRFVLERTWTSRDPRLWAALGRIGARVPTYASVHHVVPAQTAERFLDHLLRERWDQMPSAPRAAFDLARRTGDRARDIGEGMRREVLSRLEAVGAPEEWITAVREVVPVAAAERASAYGEELPVGLTVLDVAETES